METDDSSPQSKNTQSRGKPWKPPDYYPPAGHSTNNSIPILFLSSFNSIPVSNFVFRRYSLIHDGSSRLEPALLGGGLQTHYTPTKTAILSMMQYMAISLGRDQIRCNALMLGTIATQLADHDMKDPTKKAALEERIPLGRLGSPEDMAGPAVFLACEEMSRYVNGTGLLADGGKYSKLQ